MDKPPDNVVALSRYRAQLGRGRRARRADALFAAPDPQAAVRALPGDELFYTLSELGFPEATELFALATPEQVQIVFDFAVWERDGVSAARSEEWLTALAEGSHETVTAHLKGLDSELLALILRGRMRIYDLSQEEPPDEPEGSLFNTPDRLFVLDFIGTEDEIRVTSQLMDGLYRGDQIFARRFLVGVRSEMDAELEELALRWRSGRMADLGFVDFYEALEVYREIDPASVVVKEAPLPRQRPVSGGGEDALRIPRALAERLANGSPFSRAIAAITDSEELRDIHFALVALCNRVLSADRVTPGNEEAVKPVLERVAATLDLAVESLARGSDERAVQAIRSVPLMRLFQLGHSLTAKLRRLALALRCDTPFARIDQRLDLLELEMDEIVTAITRLRPMFPRMLESPPTPGERPFGSLTDIATATAAIERAGAGIALLLGLGIRPGDLAPDRWPALGVSDPGTIDAGILARTMLVPRLLGRPAAPLGPLASEVTDAFEKQFHDRSKIRELHQELSTRIREIVGTAASAGTLGPAMGAVMNQWAASLVPLGPVLTPRGPRIPSDRAS